MGLQPFESTGGTEGMPALCQGPSHKPQYDQSPHPALFQPVSMDQLSSGAPSLPCLSWVVVTVQRQEFKALALGLGPPAAEFPKPTRGQAGSTPFPECAQLPQCGHLCSFSSTLPACCQLHRLQLYSQQTPQTYFSGQRLPDSQAGGAEDEWHPALQPNSQVA